MNEKVFHISVSDLLALGPDKIPDAFIPARHLIYSSPATLAYNSPGAIGFGVKRAALVIPESVMLLVSPGCCGRNSTVLSAEEGYSDRIFYLLLDETDIVTGRHLSRIPEAVKEVMEVCDPKPKVLSICLTCVDALLGTDLERICRKAEEATGIKVVPTYMYALEREGRKPPMTQVRQTIWSLLKRGEVDPRQINLMGYFTALAPESELIPLLQEAGIRRVCQMAECESLEDYQEMGKSNFNLVLDPESEYAAEDLRKRLGMPYVMFRRLFNPDQIHKQYQIFARSLGLKIDDSAYYESAKARRAEFAENFAGKSVVLGEMAKFNSFDIAGELASMGLKVPAVFSNVTVSDFPYLKRLAQISPSTEIFVGIDPSMVGFEEIPADAAFGKDACLYCPSVSGVERKEETEPFGFNGFIEVLDLLEEALR